MISFDKIKEGDVLWDCHKTRVGNTKITRMGAWRVNVIQVDTENRKALVSWNGNTSEWWRERRIHKLRRTPVAGSI